MPLLASDVQLPTDLSTVFQGVGGKGAGAINANYGTLKKRFSADARMGAGGDPNAPGGYPGQRFSIQEGLDTGGLESALGGTYGDTAYKERLAQRNFGQQEEISNEISEAMRPSILQQIFQGIGGAGQAAGNAYALSKGQNWFGGSRSGGGTSGNPRTSLFDNNTFGYPRYGYA